MLIATSFIMVVILLLQAPPLVYYRKWRDLVFFLLFWVSSTVYALLVVLEVPLKRPPEIIEAVIRYLLGFLGIS